jgi:hypothetical protein
MQTCAKCGNQTVTVHLLGLDNGRRTWLVCCLCTAELVNELDSTQVVPLEES